jgi:hypothetical protein
MVSRAVATLELRSSVPPDGLRGADARSSGNPSPRVNSASLHKVFKTLRTGEWASPEHRAKDGGC